VTCKKIQPMYILFRSFLGFFVLCSLLVPFSAARAQQLIQGDTPLVEVRLLPEHNTIAPGGDLWIGIEQIIRPGWHTYWKNPGDSGAEPRLKWNLPDGFEIDKIQWPTPEKLPYGPLLNYGYSDHVVLLQKLRAPDTLPEGPLSLMADFEILVCKDECIPQFGTLPLTLNDPAQPARITQGKLPWRKQNCPRHMIRRPLFM